MLYLLCDALSWMPQREMDKVKPEFISLEHCVKSNSPGVQLTVLVQRKLKKLNPWLGACTVEKCYRLLTCSTGL